MDTSTDRSCCHSAELVMASRVFLVLKSYLLCCSVKAANVSDLYTRAVKRCTQKYKIKGEGQTQRGRNLSLSPAAVSPGHPARQLESDAHVSLPHLHALDPACPCASSKAAKTHFHQGTSAALLPPPHIHLSPQRRDTSSEQHTGSEQRESAMS